MIIAASVIYFDENKISEVEELIRKYPSIETHQEDRETGKMVITIEAENNKDIEDIEADFKSNDFIIDFCHYAFHFGEEVDKVISGAPVPDFNIKKPFTSKQYK